VAGACRRDNCQIHVAKVMPATQLVQQPERRSSTEQAGLRLALHISATSKSATATTLLTAGLVSVGR
jgi:hypothetical protein